MRSYNTFAKFYDSLTQNVNYQDISLFIDRVLAENSAERGILLDLACGTGSLSVKMSKLGYDVIGVDYSTQMLSEAMQKACQEDEDILFLCQSMQELDLYGTVDFAICVLDSLNHVKEKDLIETFKRVSMFLNPNGLFIFDFNTKYKHEKILANNTFVYDCDDVYCVWQNSLENDHVNISLDFFERENDVYYRSEENFSEYTYDKKFILELIKNSGLEIVACYDDYSLKEPNHETQRIVYLTRKV